MLPYLPKIISTAIFRKQNYLVYNTVRRALLVIIKHASLYQSIKINKILTTYNFSGIPSISIVCNALTQCAWSVRAHIQGLIVSQDWGCFKEC